MALTAKLLRLYQVDKQVRGLQSRVKTAERFLNLRERELAEIDAKCESLKAQSRQLQATTHNDEAEMKGLDERIAKLREQLNSATTNKQYTAFLTEVNTVKADKAAVEERALEAMTRLDEVKEQLRSFQEKREGVVKLRDHAAAERDEKAAEIKSRLEELQKERAAAAAELPKDVLADFEHEVAQRDDDVMAPIEEMNRRAMEYCCGACQVLLPFELVSSTISGGAIKKCSNCGAFLYIEEETREAALPNKR